MKPERPRGLGGLSAAKIQQLRVYADVLRERAVPLGLVSPGDAGRLWRRHVLDSLRGAACVPIGPGAIADLGAGAGLPGIPLAIALPHRQFVLIEPRLRAAGFLELAVQALELQNVEVRAARAEETAREMGCCLARAMAAEQAWRLARKVLLPEGSLVYWAGRSWSVALERALTKRGATVRVCAPPYEEGGGPVVIMARTVDPANRATQ